MKRLKGLAGLVAVALALAAVPISATADAFGYCGQDLYSVFPGTFPIDSAISAHLYLDELWIDQNSGDQRKAEYTPSINLQYLDAQGNILYTSPTFDAPDTPVTTSLYSSPTSSSGTWMPYNWYTLPDLNGAGYYPAATYAPTAKGLS